MTNDEQMQALWDRLPGNTQLIKRSERVSRIVAIPNDNAILEGVG